MNKGKERESELIIVSSHSAKSFWLLKWIKLPFRSSLCREPPCDTSFLMIPADVIIRTYSDIYTGDESAPTAENQLLITVSEDIMTYMCIKPDYPKMAESTVYCI